MYLPDDTVVTPSALFYTATRHIWPIMPDIYLSTIITLPDIRRMSQAISYRLVSTPVLLRIIIFVTICSLSFLSLRTDALHNGSLVRQMT